MILIIFRQIRDLLAMVATIQRQLETLIRQNEARQHQLEQIEQKLDVITVMNGSELAILSQLKDAIIPAPAVRLVLTAGPIEEQPN